MAFPVMNSPMFPSVADVPGLPPKFGEMPIVNGTAYYVCDDGFAGTMSAAQAINRNQNCKAPYGGGMPMARVGTGLWGGEVHGLGRRRLGEDPAPAPAPAPAPTPIIQQVPVYYPVPQAPPAPAPAPVTTTVVNEIPPAYLVGGAVAAVAIGFLLSKLG